jgi:hypothetical protein
MSALTTRFVAILPAVKVGTSRGPYVWQETANLVPGATFATAQVVHSFTGYETIQGVFSPWSLASEAPREDVVVVEAELGPVVEGSSIEGLCVSSQSMTVVRVVPEAELVDVLAGEQRVVLSSGAVFWLKDGLVHRDTDDEPAVIGKDGSKSWYRNGKRHRDGDLPAVVDAAGNQEWWIHNKRHRDNNDPAVVNVDGTKAWWHNGELVRDPLTRITLQRT